ncbi:Protein phosphatase 1 regulatory subunit 14B [Chelonia mydas]|uniref:Protein phosphatase 1 regulatory subunit 14B n=1 Tax=Chelonia mydas TaxID=8469 RepID=M7AMN9_CHEMY|nr:Protein phosphatase 1 regulatory subunit 14B [Chelonia mydas]
MGAMGGEEHSTDSPPGEPGQEEEEGPGRRQGKVTVKYERKELRKRLNLEEWILEQLTQLYDCQGKVTVKYERKELRKRLNLEEWILEQLTQLYDCQEEEIPELEIDVDELLDMGSDDARGARVKAFVGDLLDKIRGMQKLSTPQKK